MIDSQPEEIIFPNLFKWSIEDYFYKKSKVDVNDK